jgi:hypothetical protein
MRTIRIVRRSRSIEILDGELNLEILSMTRIEREHGRFIPMRELKRFIPAVRARAGVARTVGGEVVGWGTGAGVWAVVGVVKGTGEVNVVGEGGTRDGEGVGGHAGFEGEGLGDEVTLLGELEFLGVAFLLIGGATLVSFLIVLAVIILAMIMLLTMIVLLAVITMLAVIMMLAVVIGIGIGRLEKCSLWSGSSGGRTVARASGLRSWRARRETEDGGLIALLAKVFVSCIAAVWRRDRIRH